MVSPRPSTPPPQLPERRRVPRHHLALDVAFGAAGTTQTPPAESQLEQTVTVNISLGGLCLYSDILYPVGTPLFCALTLPGRTAPLRITGTLVWFQKVDQKAHAYKLGIEFVRIAPEEAAALQAFFDHPPAAEASKSKRVLLVEDEAELRMALKVRFESAGFHVLTSGDGLDALRRGREEHPDLILLDLMLPNLNGYEVCRLLKFDRKFRHIPIILFTARSRREDMEMGRAVGADAYMTKPFNGSELLAKVDELLSAARG